MNQLSVFDKGDLKFLFLQQNTPVFFCYWTMGEMEQPMPKALDGHLSPLYICKFIIIYNIYFSILCRCFFRDWLSKLLRMALLKKTPGVYYKRNEWRDYQKIKPSFAADLCHSGSFSRSGTLALSDTTTVAVISPLFVGLIVFSALETWGPSSQLTWGRSQKS